MSRRVVFSDLDDTLLDAAYSFEPARPALAELARRGIPLVLCSSKTAAEMLHVRDRLGLRDPFIVENGAAVHLPDGSRVALATPLPPRIPGIRGFRDMSDAEVAAAAGLPLEDAARARRREFDEPFLCPPEDEAGLPELAARLGLRLTRGGRFWHLHGDSDKGRAVRHVRGLYPDARALALGDSPNDLPMLLAADVAVAVPRPDGRVHPALEAGVPGLRRAPAPGPAGWNEAVLAWLRDAGK